MDIWFAYPNVEIKVENVENVSVRANEAKEHLNFANDFQDKIKSDVANSDYADHNDEYFNPSGADDVGKSISVNRKSVTVKKKIKKVKLKASTMKFECDICGSRYF